MGAPEPIACTLNPAAFADRATMWRVLLEATLLRRESVDRGVRLVLRPDAEAQARRLVALEAECCAWFAGTVTGGGEVRVDLVAQTEDGAAVLQGMFG